MAWPKSKDSPQESQYTTRAVTGWRAWLVRIFGSSFGLGYIPFASGTFGTLPAVGLFILVADFAPPHLHAWLLGAMVVVTSVACVFIGNWAEGVWGKKDPGRFTFDEMAGYLLTVLLFHPSAVPLQMTLAWTFLATRLFDIIKIPPARQVEKLRGGWGILLDDLICSVQAAAALHLVLYFRPAMMM